MALHWAAKAPADIREYTWAPRGGVSVASASFTVSTGTATVAYDLQGDAVELTVSGGTAGVTQIIAASAVVGDETITETIYIPVIASTRAFSTTANDVCAFALRKVVGNGDTAEAEELDDALERLNDMLALWTIDGLDLGIPLPVVSATVLYCPDAAILALKYNLALNLAEHYGRDPGGLMEMAVTSRSKVRNVLLTLGDLSAPPIFTHPRPLANWSTLDA